MLSQVENPFLNPAWDSFIISKTLSLTYSVSLSFKTRNRLAITLDFPPKNFKISITFNASQKWSRLSFNFWCWSRVEEFWWCMKTAEIYCYPCLLWSEKKKEKWDKKKVVLIITLDLKK